MVRCATNSALFSCSGEDEGEGGVRMGVRVKRMAVTVTMILVRSRGG